MTPYFLPETVKKTLCQVTTVWNQDFSLEQQQYLMYYDLPILNKGQHILGKLQYDELDVAVQAWKPCQSKKTIFLIHGYSDHMGLYANIIRFFLDQQYCVIAFDLPGHGLSTGQPGYIQNFSSYASILEDCLQWVIECEVPTPYVIYGNSTGASAVIDSIGMNQLQSRYPIEALLFAAPLVRLNHWFLIRCARYIIGLFTQTIKKKITKVSNRQYLCQDPLRFHRMPLSWLDALYHWENKIKKSQFMNNLPVLVIQGTADKRVNWRYNIHFLSKYFACLQILYLENETHLLHFSSHEVKKKYLSAIIDWLNQNYEKD
ncbi:MAG: alpha/beta hydrolase [Endozoicomonadaceae bacterium]|nr:alpha/beta hydrolase [Endozoicomonadaceae bacterium]